MYEKNRFPSFNGLGHYFGQTTAQVNPQSGNIYWGASGPIFSKQTLVGTQQAEAVPPPTIIPPSPVSVVRDKPRIKLSPIAGGLGEWSTAKVVLPVLGLIIVGFLLYRR